MSNPRDQHAGLLLENVTPDLAQVVWNALFSNRMASEGDTLPSGKKAGSTGDRGGWWANPLFGSRLWLLQRAKLVQGTLVNVQTYAEEALRPLIVGGYLKSAVAAAEFTYTNNVKSGVSVKITLTKPDGTTGSITYESLWAQLGL